MAKDNCNVCESKVFEAIYNAYAKDIRRFLFYKTQDVDKAEDILQEEPNGYFRIYQDNGQGLDKIGLEKSLQAACSEKNQLNHKGLYGVGFNIAMSKLSKKTDIFTKTQGQEKWLHCEYDPQKIKQQLKILRP
jgi:hypothetical protein